MILSFLKNKDLILASSSPRRIELLKRIYPNFQIKKSSFDELSFWQKTKNNNWDSSLELDNILKKISLGKAKTIKTTKNSLIIAADTVVTVNKKILGKPTDKEHAIEMLKTLSGKKHQVKTSISVINAQTNYQINEVTTTDVYFKKLSNKEIRWYINNDQIDDKAGSYAIQGKACIFVEKINGCYYNVMGLPINNLYKILKKFRNQI